VNSFTVPPNFHLRRWNDLTKADWPLPLLVAQLSRLPKDCPKIAQGLPKDSGPAIIPMSLTPAI